MAANGRSHQAASQRPLWQTTWLSGQGLRRTRTSTPLPRHVAGPDRGPSPGSRLSPQKTKRTPETSRLLTSQALKSVERVRATWCSPARKAHGERPAIRSLDLGCLELDVLARDGVVLLEAQLVGAGARVLLCNVEVAGAGSLKQLDFLCDWLCHDVLKSSAHHAGSI